MNFLVAIVVYGCEIAGSRTPSIDIQVRYFESSDADAIERRIRAEPPHEYLNDQGETVSWPFLRIAALESVDELKDGAEIAGFITEHDAFGNWVRGNEA